MTIYWNNSLLCTIEMSDIQEITYAKGSGLFYTKAIVRNAEGVVKNTINDARIAAQENATIAFAVRGTKMLVDNISLQTGFRYTEPEKIAPSEKATYSGSQIRTTLVPYKNESGEIIESDLRQGLRFCFEVADIGDKFEYEGVEYTINDEGALVILKEKLSDSILMTVDQVGVLSGIVKQDSLIDVMIDSKTYKSAYIYNIPESGKDAVICARVFLECEDADGNLVYFYTEIQEKSLTSVYQSIEDVSILDESVRAWWE